MPLRIGSRSPEDHNRPWEKVLAKVSIMQILLIVCVFC